MNTLPYKIAVLCYLYNEAGELLLLHRAQPPNQGLYSPIGGKLHMHAGESPLNCAIREIEEEVELKLQPTELHLTGIVSETAYQNENHWLLFLYEVNRPVHITRMAFNEGTLEWHPWDHIPNLNIPETDRHVIYPLVKKFHNQFFHVHIDCSKGTLDWHIQHPVESVEPQN